MEMRALVTGASAGLGAEFARQLAADGFSLVLVARDEARLRSLADELVAARGTEVEVLAADLLEHDDLERVAALTDLTKLLLPAMVVRGRGRILNVASTAAFGPGPFMAVYYATKAYVLSLSQALSNELHGTGVTVTALCPGPTRTGFAAAAGAGARPSWQARMVMDAATVARAGYQGMMRGDTMVVPGFLNKLLTQSTRLLPRSVQARITRRVVERRIHA